MTRAVSGADQLVALAADLKAAGNKELRRELFRELSRALKPAKPAVRAAMEGLPRRGGFAASVLETTVLKQSIKTGQRSVGAYIKGVGKHDIYNLNKGRLRHPLYGNRDHWYTQQVTPGFFDRPLEALEPEVAAKFIAGMGRIQRMLAGK